jgi:hypothetical protein
MEAVFLSPNIGLFIVNSYFNKPSLVFDKRSSPPLTGFTKMPAKPNAVP